MCKRGHAKGMEPTIHRLSNLCLKQRIVLIGKKSLVNNLSEIVIWENLLIAYRFCLVSRSPPGALLAPRWTASAFLQGGGEGAAAKCRSPKGSSRWVSLWWQVPDSSFFGLLGLICPEVLTGTCRLWSEKKKGSPWVKWMTSWALEQKKLKILLANDTKK